MMLDMSFKKTGLRLWGWFEEPGQIEPDYDPPHDAPCPYCLAPITADDVRTSSLMFVNPTYAKRSYFYRKHRTCDEAAKTSDKSSEMHSRILDAIAKTGD